MLGLLGGLLGGGLLGGKKGGGGGGGIKGYSPRAPQSPPMTPAPQEQPRQTKGEVQTAEPEKQPAQESMVDNAAQPIEQAAPEPVKNQGALDGLLGDTKAAPTPQTPRQDEQLKPPSVVNLTGDKTPVAKMQDQQFGATPTTEKTDILSNRLFDAGGNKQPFEYQEGLPARQLQTDSEWTPAMGLQYQQPTTVAGSVPARRYRS
jgi:hypothetical protein